MLLDTLEIFTAELQIVQNNHFSLSRHRYIENTFSLESYFLGFKNSPDI